MKDEWNALASNLLKSELKRKGLSYSDLSQRLARIGVENTAQNLNKTINLGKFSFAFFLQCANVLDLNKLQLD